MIHFPVEVSGWAFRRLMPEVKTDQKEAARRGFKPKVLKQTLPNQLQNTRGLATPE